MTEPLSASAELAEYSLVEKVELRLALANTDTTFEKALAVYLCPLLLKFASKHAKVRAQIGKIVKYLFTRINSSPNVKLPLEALLKQVKTPNLPEDVDPTSVQSYSLLFMSKGITRISEDEQKQLIPMVIQGISQMKESVAARLFNVLCKLISSSWKIQDRATVKPEEIRKFLGFTDEIGKSNIGDEHYLIDKFSKFMLLQPIPLTEAGTIPLSFTLPGLSNEDCKFFTYNAGVTFDSGTLTNYKQSILRFIEYGWHPNHNLIMIIASADSSSSIQELANSMLKRETIDYEDEYIVDSLILLFIGDLAVSRPPVKLQLQERLMSYCCQSKRAAKSPHVGVLSSIGLNSDYAKLKQTTIKFIKWVTTITATESDTDIASSSTQLNVGIAAQLKANLQLEEVEMSSSSSTSNYQVMVAQRSYQYEALGLILRKSPKLDDLSFIQFLFDSLSRDSSDLRTTIVEALGGLTIHLPKLTDSQKLELLEYLKGILSSTMNPNSPSNNLIRKDNTAALRYMAIKFINHTLPFNDPQARMLCIYGLTDADSSMTQEEAEKGLNPYWFNILQTSDSLDLGIQKSQFDIVTAKTFKFPEFNKLVRQLSLLNQERENDSLYADHLNFFKAIEFTYQCLVMQAIGEATTVVTLDQDWANRLDKALIFDHTVNELFAKELLRLSTSDSNVDLDGDEIMMNGDFEKGYNSSLEIFISIMINECITNKTIKGEKHKHEIFRYLLKIFSMCDSTVLDKFADKLHSFESCLDIPSYNSSEEIHSCVSRIIAILCSSKATSDSDILKTLDYLISINDPLSSGFTLSRVIIDKERRKSLVTEELFNRVIDSVFEQLESRSSVKQKLAIDGLSELILFGAFTKSLNISSKIDSYLTTFKEKIEPMIKKSDERATLAWAYLGLSVDDKTNEADEGDDNDVTEFERLIFDNHNSKQIDYFFTSGEALSVLASGWDSSFLKRKVEVINQDKEKLLKPHDRLTPILKHVLKLCQNTKPALRKACCLWLLSLTQYCGHSPVIKEHSQEIHVAFMRFLTERDDIIQESASRGLNMIYEMGDTDLKDTLVHNLLVSFTDSNKTKALSSQTMNHDTTLFESGVLNTGDGSVSTYKDILNLASEVGDPGLVYKFMSLAQHSALWSSRKGIAFGLGAVLTKSKLDDLLQKDKNLSSRLIPKLFRYRFDPSKAVSDSMNEIWNTLINDSSAVINTNFELILKDLISSMGSREWRVRQASTTALQDLLSSLPLEKYEGKLEEIWTMSFRVMDDIKDSVRKQGNSLTRYLASTMVKSISSDSGSLSTSERSNHVLQQLIPFLLGNNGLLAESEEVRSFAFDTILKLAKSSSHALKPFVGDMVEQMIVLMSTIEPQIINYLTLNADKYNLKADDIDSRRLQSVGTSPMMEAIEKLLGLLDDSLMEAFIVHLSNGVKRSVGLPSKVAGSKVIVTLVIRHIFIAKNYGDKLLKLASSQMKDKNETIAASYATACGYCCRIASVNQIRKFADKISKFYFESGVDNNSAGSSNSTRDERLKYIAGIASESVAKYSGDKFQSMASAFLPLAFIAKNDSNTKVSKPFEREWSDSTGGAGAIKLYLNEIIELVKSNIESQSFEIRQVCAKSIVEATNKLGGGSNLGNAETTSDLFKVLIQACKGRSWKGKENILDSLVSLSLKSEQFLGDSELLEIISKTVLVEAKRNNKEYQKHSILSLGRFIATFPDSNPELIPTYVEITDKLLSDEYYQDSEDEDAMDVDDGNKKRKLKEINRSSRENVEREDSRLEILRNIRGTISINEELNFYSSPELLKCLLNSIEKIYASEYVIISWRSKICICESLVLVFDKLAKLSYQSDDENAKRINKQVISIWERVKLDIFGDQDGFKSVLQNVMTQFIRLTKSCAELLKKVESDQSDVDLLVNYIYKIQEANANPVINTEIENNFS